VAIKVSHRAPKVQSFSVRYETVATTFAAITSDSLTLYPSCLCEQMHNQLLHREQWCLPLSM
jgi:hypothetical protein